MILCNIDLLPSWRDWFDQDSALATGLQLHSQAGEPEQMSEHDWCGQIRSFFKILRVTQVKQGENGEFKYVRRNQSIVIYLFWGQQSWNAVQVSILITWKNAMYKDYINEINFPKLGTTTKKAEFLENLRYLVSVLGKLPFISINWLVNYFLLHVNFTERQPFTFILLLANTEARQTKKNTFYKTENMYV